jgi:transcriptional regulator with XRE-family HTH domain
MIGDRIKERRIEIGMTQDELAKKLGYKTRSTITKIEKNENDVNQTTLKKIADALDVPPAYFIEIVEHPTRKKYLMSYFNKLIKMSDADIDNVCQYIDFLTNKKEKNK